MTKAHCPSCSSMTLHNQRLKDGKDLGLRCTKCGLPRTSRIDQMLNNDSTKEGGTRPINRLWQR